jgi:hypothetical protein
MAAANVVIVEEETTDLGTCLHEHGSQFEIWKSTKEIYELGVINATSTNCVQFTRKNLTHL